MVKEKTRAKTKKPVKRENLKTIIKPKSKKKKLIFLIIILIILSVGVYFYIMFKPISFIEEKGITLTEETLPAYLERHPVIQALPEDSKIRLEIGDATYFIDGSEVTLVSEETGEIQLSPDEIDAVIELPDGFEKEIGQDGLCGAVSRDNFDNEGFEFTTEKSESKLLVKYGIYAARVKDCV